MESNMSIRKCRERAVWCIALATLLFVVVSLGTHMVKNYDTTNTMVVRLQDGSTADVLVILYDSYNKSQWTRLHEMITNAAETTSDIEALNENLPTQLIELGHPIIAFSIDRQKNVILRKKGSKNP